MKDFDLYQRQLSEQSRQEKQSNLKRTRWDIWNWHLCQVIQCFISGIRLVVSALQTKPERGQVEKMELTLPLISKVILNCTRKCSHKHEQFFQVKTKELLITWYLTNVKCIRMYLKVNCQCSKQKINVHETILPSSGPGQGQAKAQRSGPDLYLKVNYKGKFKEDSEGHLFI